MKKMYVPYVREDCSYRRLEWSMEPVRAQHTVTREFSKRTGCKGHAIIMTNKDGQPIRDHRGNILLFNDITLIRVGFLKELTCSTCSIAPRHQQPVFA